MKFQNIWNLGEEGSWRKRCKNIIKEDWEVEEEDNIIRHKIFIACSKLEKPQRNFYDCPAFSTSYDLKIAQNAMQ